MFEALVRLAVASSVLVTLGLSTQSNAQEKEAGAVTSTAIQQRGHQLSVDLKRAYNTLVESNSLKSPSQGMNDISDVVIKYIPAGMSFDDAERILHSAGFTVVPRSMKYHEGAPNFRDDVLGQLILSQKFPISTEAVVTLSPLAVGNYEKVEKVQASIVAIGG